MKKLSVVCLLIPLIPATHSEGFRPAVPIEGGHLFRSIPATLSERSDAGFLVLSHNDFIRSSRNVFFSSNLLSGLSYGRYGSGDREWHRRW